MLMRWYATIYFYPGPGLRLIPEITLAWIKIILWLKTIKIKLCNTEGAFSKGKAPYIHHNLEVTCLKYCQVEVRHIIRSDSACLLHKWTFS